MEFRTHHHFALFLASLWSQRHWMSLEDDLDHFRTLELPNNEVYLEALFGMCKAKLYV